MGDMFAADSALADLFMLLLRKGIERRGDALRAYLTDLLCAELEPITDALAELERKLT